MLEKHESDDHENGHELQADPPSHELLAQVGALALHHGPEAHEEDDENRSDRDRRQMKKYGVHATGLTNLVRANSRTMSGVVQIVAPSYPCALVTTPDYIIAQILATSPDEGGCETSPRRQK